MAPLFFQQRARPPFAVAEVNIDPALLEELGGVGIDLLYLGPKTTHFQPNPIGQRLPLFDQNCTGPLRGFFHEPSREQNH